MFKYVVEKHCTRNWYEYFELNLQVPNPIQPINFIEAMLATKTISLYVFFHVAICTCPKIFNTSCLVNHVNATILF